MDSRPEYGGKLIMTNVLEYMEGSVDLVPEKTAFSNGEEEITFRELSDRSRATGSALAEKGLYREPVVVYMHKSPDMVNAFFGVLYSGCFYVPIDEEMPKSRIDLILENVQTDLIIRPKLHGSPCGREEKRLFQSGDTDAVRRQ